MSSGSKKIRGLSCSLSTLEEVDDDDKAIIEELNRLKRKVYTTENKEGFNSTNGYFYTGKTETVVPHSSRLDAKKEDKRVEIIYRDESDNISFHYISERTERIAKHTYPIDGIPLNPVNLASRSRGCIIMGGVSPEDNNHSGSYTGWNLLQLREECNKLGLDCSNKQIPGCLKLLKEYNQNLQAEAFRIQEEEEARVAGIQAKEGEAIRLEGNLVKNVQDTRKRKRKSSNSNNTKTRTNSHSPAKKSKKRKAVEFNAFELIMALILEYKVTDLEHINIVLQNQDVISKIGLEQETFDNYVVDLRLRPKGKVNKYITVFYEKNKNQDGTNFINLSDIRQVKLTGKGGDMNEKSDILFKYENDAIPYGISVKQSQDATLSNYSVNKILNRILKNTSVTTNLQNLKKNIIKQAGLDIKNKDHRCYFNELFYDLFTNEYWMEMRKQIKTNSKAIANIILSAVNCENTKRTVYEYDGNCVRQFIPGGGLNNCDIVEAGMEVYENAPCGAERQAAKMFYNILKDGNIIYRCEIRHKGSWTASPQFLLYKIA